MAHIAFFLRVSGKQQQLESQYDEMVRYAKLENVPPEDIITIQYKESGRKLTEEERLGLKDFKEICEHEPIRVCYVSELSRISRTEDVLYSFIKFLKEHKIQLICKNPSFTLFKEDFSDMIPNARILVGMFAALAAQEVVEKEMRFARGKERKAKEGKYNGGAIPYGYKIDETQDNLIVIDEEEAKIIREIYNMYENGMSQPSIAKELFHRGVKGRSVRKTKGITISLVHQILTNELLTGKPQIYKHNSENVNNEYERRYPQIITQEQYDRCRDIANSNNRRLPKTKYIHYAQGLIKCTECGRNFVSSGYKCNYHCKDAYNYNKQYDGYYGEPRCSNKTCISSNIMDSLLWEMSKDFECTYIMDSAQHKLSECSRERDILVEKLNAIPILLEENEAKMDSLLDAYSEGMKRERYLEKKAIIAAEKREIHKQEAEYREQILHYEALIAEVKKSLDLDFNLDTEDKMDSFIDRTEEIWKRVSSITDDKERSEIIHRHIKKVTVENIVFNYKFRIHPEGKDVKAKKIVVYPYISDEQTFIFIPNDGKGGTMLELYPSAGEVISIPAVPSLGEIVVPQYRKYYMEYLPRLSDIGKKRQRATIKANRDKTASEMITEIRNGGYLSMDEMITITGLSRSAIYKAIKGGKMEGVNVCKTWFVKKSEFESYMKRFPPKPKTKKSHVHSQEQAAKNLLDAILNFKEE